MPEKTVSGNLISLGWTRGDDDVSAISVGSVVVVVASLTVQ